MRDKFKTSSAIGLAMLSLACMALLSCGNNQKEIGKYVYVDFFNNIHIDRECESFTTQSPRAEEESMAKMLGVQFVDTCDLISSPDRPLKFCPKCVDDETFQHLSSIIERNEY